MGLPTVGSNPTPSATVLFHFIEERCVASSATLSSRGVEMVIRQMVVDAVF
ncbi:MAG: hypothetical protein HKL86_00950 [Acidimicrobiaceae bacterium]|nr:hypothetical protein [Acidimicrobiaceae bacterium]